MRQVLIVLASAVMVFGVSNRSMAEKPSLLVPALTVVGQADVPTNLSLKPLQQFVGNWQVRVTFKDSEINKRVTYKWVMDGQFLEGTFSDMSGKRFGTEMFG